MTFDEFMGNGFVLARSANGPLCLYRGRAFSLKEASATGLFADREDPNVVLAVPLPSSPLTRPSRVYSRFLPYGEDGP